MPPLRKRQCRARPRPPPPPLAPTLHLFPLLPPEIRSMIFVFAMTPRKVTISTREVVKVAWHDLNTATGHKYPTPTRAQRHDANGNEIEPKAIFERLAARSTRIPLLEVCMESRLTIMKHYKFEIEALEDTPKVVKLRSNRALEICEDIYLERNWEPHPHIEQPRFLVRQRQPSAIVRINPDIDIINLDDLEPKMLHLAMKWLPTELIQEMRRFSMTFEHFKDPSTQSLGQSFYRFSALEELIIFVEAYRATGYLSNVRPNNVALGSIDTMKRAVVREVEAILALMLRRCPWKSWRKPALKVFKDVKSLKRLRNMKSG